MEKLVYGICLICFLAFLIFCISNTQTNAKEAWMSGKCKASYETCMKHWR